VEDRVVLDGSRDDLLAVALPAGSVSRTAQGKIIALAAAGREDASWASPYRLEGLPQWSRR